MCPRVAARGRLSVLLTAGIVLCGCAHTITAPPLPSVPAPPPIPAPEGAEFLPELPPPVQFVPKPGTESKKTIDDVTVEVESIVTSGRREGVSYTTQIDGPDGRTYEVSLIPQVVTIRVSNATDHIVTLGRTAMLTGTVIRLEDEQQRPFLLYKNMAEMREKLRKRIDEAFKRYAKQAAPGIGKAGVLSLTGKRRLGDRRTDPQWQRGCSEAFAKFEKSFRLTYGSAFQSFSQEVDKYCLGWRSMFYTVTLRGPMSVEAAVLSKWNEARLAQLREYGLSRLPGRTDLEKEKGQDETPAFSASFAKDFRNERAPEEVLSCVRKVYEEKKEAAQQDQALASARGYAEIMKFKNAALKKVQDIPEVRNVITEGDYPPIRVLPGRTVDIHVPFADPDRRKITEMDIHVIDLPTKVDAAGVPSKRANFSFAMVPVSAK